MGYAPLRLISLVVLVLASPPALAQDWSQPWADPQDRPPRVDISASAGFLMPTRWTDLVLLGSIAPSSGVLEQVFTRGMSVEPDKEYEAAATYWIARYGFRAQAGYSRSSLTIGGSPLAGGASPASAGNTTSVGIETWLYDVRGAIGLLDYAPSRAVWPYGFIGLGGITYRLKRTITPPLTFIESGTNRPGSRPDTIVVVDGGRQFLVSIAELKTDSVFAFNIGLGTDFRVPLGAGGLGVRLEIADHIAPSPIVINLRELSTPFAFAPVNDVRFRIVHHLSATAGLVLQFGR
jgi:hypothetical protein